MLSDGIPRLLWVGVARKSQNIRFTEEDRIDTLTTDCDEFLSQFFDAATTLFAS